MFEGLARCAVGNGALGVILNKVRVLEAGDSAHNIETLFVQTANDLFVEGLFVACAAVVGGRILLHSVGLVAGALVVFDVDNEGVDFGLLGQRNILLNLLEHVGASIQIERVAGRRHRVVGKLGLLDGVEVATDGLATTKGIFDGLVNGVVLLGLVAQSGLLGGKYSVLAIDVALNVATAHLVGYHLTVVVHSVVIDYCELARLVGKACNLATLDIAQQRCRGAHPDGLLLNDLAQGGHQSLLGGIELALFEHHLHKAGPIYALYTVGIGHHLGATQKCSCGRECAILGLGIELGGGGCRGQVAALGELFINAAPQGCDHK